MLFVSFFCFYLHLAVFYFARTMQQVLKLKQSEHSFFPTSAKVKQCYCKYDDKETCSNGYQVSLERNRENYHLSKNLLHCNTI